MRDSHMCAYTSKHSSHKPLFLFSLSLASTSLQAQELRDLLTLWHFFQALCIMFCPQWALHQDMFTHPVTNVFPNILDFNFEDNNAVDIQRHNKLLKTNQSS